MAQFINPFPGLLENGILDANALIQALRQAHAAEGEAVHLYETLAKHIDNELVAEVLKDIAREEQVHLGELQQLIDQLDKNEVGAQAEGRKEVQDKKAHCGHCGKKAPDALPRGVPDNFRRNMDSGESPFGKIDKVKSIKDFLKKHKKEKKMAGYISEFMGALKPEPEEGKCVNCHKELGAAGYSDYFCSEACEKKHQAQDKKSASIITGIIALADKWDAEGKTELAARLDSLIGEDHGE